MNELILNPGQVYELTEALSLDRLVIAEGAELKAPARKQVTLLVDGVQALPLAGEYTGKVQLVVADSILLEYNHFGTLEYKELSAAFCAIDGKYQPDCSVKEAVLAGTFEDGHCSGITVKSNGDYLGGIHLGGSGEYVIDDPVMELNGNGADDGVGMGAAIAIRDDVHATINRAQIHNTGSIRTAIVAYGNSVVEVNDSDISCQDGTRSNYVRAMTKAPWMLGIHGRVRSTNIQESATVTYNRCHIKAENWGAMSSDGAVKIGMYANDCLIEVTGSGYGAYSIGDTINTFKHSQFKVPDYAVIMASDGFVTFTDGTTVDSDRFGVMMHGGGGDKGLLKVDNGSVFNTGMECFVMKNRGANILCDGAELNSGNGTVILMMENDDLNTRGVVCGPETVMEPPPGGFPKTEEPEHGHGGHGGPPPEGEGGPGGPGGPGGEGPGGGPGGPGGPESQGVAPVRATFKNMEVKGDMLDGFTKKADLFVSLENAKLTGAVSSCTLYHPQGMPDAPDQYPLVGVTEKFICPNDDEFGAHVSLDGGSVWNVSKTSYLRGLTIAEGGQVLGAELTVNGVAVPLAAGEYSGRIVLTVK